MTKKKKIVILSCMIALLAVTSIFNFVFTTGSTSATQTTIASSSSYFAGYRTERLNSRNEELVQLDGILSLAEANSDEYNQALQMKMDITQNTENELLLENLIKAYGFEDAVVLIGLDSDNVNVIVKSETASTDEAIAIYTIIQEEMNISPENVKIIPIS
jgi:stage III sporulation protein AH